MKIGNIEFGERPLFLAPMEDVTDIGFRQLCKRFGASMVYAEFVSAEALVRSIKSTVSKLDISDSERPVGIQIYGRDTDAMVEAARIVEQARPDVIDLNFGCPVKKVAGKGAGAGMLQNIPLMLDITRQVVRAVRTPVTVKTRLGWDSGSLIITTLAEQLQDCGIQALTIHGRTRAQMYTGNADWTLIGEVKRNPRIHIPIIGNGDITSPEDAERAFNDYGVDAVMVGRATFGRPWIFKEMRDRLDGRPQDLSLTLDRKIKFLEKQLEESQKSDTAMLDTLETAKRLMADISASAERRAELMMRDAELEAESMLLEAKTTVKKLNDEHLVLKQKVERLRGNYRAMLKLEMEKLDNDEYGLLPDLDRSDIPDIDKELKTPFGGDEAAVTQDTLVIKKKEEKAEEKTEKATVSDLSESLKNLAKEQGSIDDTIILK